MAHSVIVVIGNVQILPESAMLCGTLTLVYEPTKLGDDGLLTSMTSMPLPRIGNVGVVPRHYHILHVVAAARVRTYR